MFLFDPRQEFTPLTDAPLDPFEHDGECFVRAQSTTRREAAYLKFHCNAAVTSRPRIWIWCRFVRRTRTPYSIWDGAMFGPFE